MTINELNDSWYKSEVDSRGRGKTTSLNYDKEERARLLISAMAYQEKLMKNLFKTHAKLRGPLKPWDVDEDLR
jgi:hypothetical protein